MSNPLTPIEHPLPDGVFCPACGAPLKKLVGFRDMLTMLREQFADPQLSGWECTVSSCRAFVAVSPPKVPRSMRLQPIPITMVEPEKGWLPK